MMCDAILRFNAERKQTIVSCVAELCGGRVRGKAIAVLGLTYKPGTSTLRRSLPLEITRLLVKKGAHVKAYDPRADYGELDTAADFEIGQSIDDVLRGSDLALLLTEWPQFREYDWPRGGALMRQKQIFDAKNFLVDSGLTHKGFRYVGIGLGESQG
jgi:UDPglucose 6-dehydrogenase